MDVPAYNQVDDLDAPARSEVRTDILIRGQDGELEFHGTVGSIDTGNVLTSFLVQQL